MTDDEREHLDADELFLLDHPAKHPVDPRVHNAIVSALADKLIAERKKNIFIDDFNCKIPVA